MISNLSHSSIDLYRTCPQRWAFRYLDKIAGPRAASAAFGSAVHAAIEAMIRDGEADIDAIWAAETAGDIDWTGTTPDSQSSAYRALLKYPPIRDLIKRIIPQMTNGAPTIELRVELRLDDVPVPVIGYVDLIDHEGMAIDFKTSNKPWAPWRAGNETQPLVYLAALAQMGHPHRPLIFEHIVISRGALPLVQSFVTERVPREFNLMEHEIRTTWAAISAGDFPTVPGSCRKYGVRCPYYDRCPGPKGDG